MRKLITMRAALSDGDLFAPLFPGASWEAWRVLAIAAWGEALNEQERELFARLTQRDREPGERVETFLAAAGRRSGKTRFSALNAAYASALCEHDELAPGERPVCICVAKDQRQAAIAFSYIAAIFDATPALRKMIMNRTADSLQLANGVSIEVRAASFRALRGVTAIAALCDETCFWFNSDENSKNSDDEIIAALRPCLSTTRGPLILTSSVYAKRGETWRLFSKHFGPQGDPFTLVASGGTRDFNQTFRQATIDRALDDDRMTASAEYLSEWRSDLESFLDDATIQSCVDYTRPLELAPRAGLQYRAFIDCSAGRNDSYTISIAHPEERDDRIIIDSVRGVAPPCDPRAVTASFAALCREYGLREVTGDNFAGEWASGSWDAEGFRYVRSPMTASQLYLESLATFSRAAVSLPPHPTLLKELRNLERRVSRIGRDTVSHPMGGGAHDDFANAVCGAIVLCSKPIPRLICQTVIGHFATSNPNYRPSPPHVIEAYPPNGNHVFRNH